VPAGARGVPAGGRAGLHPGNAAARRLCGGGRAARRVRGKHPLRAQRGASGGATTRTDALAQAGGVPAGAHLEGHLDAGAQRRQERGGVPDARGAWRLPDQPVAGGVDRQRHGRRAHQLLGPAAGVAVPGAARQVPRHPGAPMFPKQFASWPRKFRLLRAPPSCAPCQYGVRSPDQALAPLCPARSTRS
jgi:hypothetical protein